ncbi:hypothetical protein ACGTNG_12780 [Halomonas sp. 1390]|uniref:hypothetical protein n=1 Tax=Halomonas sp. B23F22_3 TaxID=3459516 RepID=UPI00373ECBF0
MKERPILFNDEMVRALLDGRKTQTRRLLKPQPGTTPDDYPGAPGHWWPCNGVGSMVHVERELQNQAGGWEGFAGTVCPYGQPGDRLWVREAHALVPITAYAQSIGVDIAQDPDDDYEAAIYRTGWERSTSGFRWRPSIHMPRWACRLLLEVTDVRVERLQDTTEADARAEGAAFHDGMGVGHSGWRHDQKEVHEDARSSFARLWKSINGDGSWDANPWVWVLEFRRIDQQQEADAATASIVPSQHREESN